MRVKVIIRSLLILTVASCLWLSVTSISGCASAQTTQPASQSSSEKSGPEKAKKTQNGDQASQQESKHIGIARELVTEEREAEGEQEENAKLKYSPVVQKLGKLTGLDVHGAHMLALWLNFAIIAFAIFWFGRKSLPGMFRKRTDSIQKALEEARKASQEANWRLSDIESRLRQMDVEIGTIQQSAEKEAEGEEDRIKKAAEDEIRRVVEAAKQEIAAAAKQVRRELSTHTADLAVTLARKQISVDTETDHALVRDFAAKLNGKSSPQGNGGKDGL